MSVGEISEQDERAEPIALVGISCRLPRAADPAAFWRLLHDGVDALTDAAERWPTAPEHRRAGFLTEVAGFDAGFFGISPHEAVAMDPQQRLVLELAWEALEHAGIVPAALRETPAGVFVGAIAQDYAKLADRLGSAAGPHSYTGTHRALIANRVSYFLRLQGPSLTVDTGQSSSLVAVQLACESLRRGESRLALAGGVNLNLLGETTETIGRFGALSPDGRCYTFDERANGYARGEGAAVVVLKRLSDALADGDRVRCVILGGAVNNDGGGAGLTAPSRLAQQQVIERACAQARVRPAELDYVELHGTGTPIGDPIEAAALSAALGAGREPDQPLLVGSVKTNIGHLEGAAGIAGLVKVALSLTHRELPASLNFGKASIPLAELGLAVVEQTRDWPRPDRPLVAGVSSFGMGGTNCHLVLAEHVAVPAEPTDVAVPAEPTVSEVPAEPTVSETTAEPTVSEAAVELPWLLSARSSAGLRAQAEQLIELAGRQPRPAAVALALAGTRERLEQRAVILGEDPLPGLRALATGAPHGSLITGTALTGGTVLAFPGQGSQWPEMARELLAGSAVFAGRIVACAEALAPFVDFSLLDVLRGTPGAPDFDRVDVLQPALWAVMVGLAELWRANGVRPDVVIGHSQGEIAAATAIGALSLSDGARVVALRSKAIAAIAGSGGMMSVAAEPAVVEAAVREHAAGAAVAAINGARSVVVSGTEAELVALQTRFVDAGYRTKILPVDYASHSAAVEQLRDQLAKALAPVAPRSVPTTFISTLTGEPMDTAGLDADYWYQSLRRPVRFSQAARRALETDCAVFLECSPHPVLVGALEETFEQDGVTARALGTLRRGQGEPAQFRRALAEAYAAGVAVDWLAGRIVRPRETIELPSYPFQRSRYWLPEPAAATLPSSRPASNPVGPVSQPGREITVPAGRSRRQLRELVLASTATALGHADQVELEGFRTFKDLGVDSAIALELRNQLRTLTGLPLPTGLLFDYPTPDQLVGYLHELTAERPATEQPATEQPSAELAAAPPLPARDDQAAAADDPIAIVAMGCRYPGGVSTPEQFWELISAGAEAIGEFPANRGWDTDTLFSPAADRQATSDTSLGGFLHDADQFDAPFFGISPREALAMDPQQRLVLEICWDALEQGGVNPQRLRGSRTGVFVGAMAPDYGPRLHQPVDGVGGHLLTGTALSVVSGRVAYTFGLEGPAVTVDTACSSSLVAIHLAVQALRRGECSLALAGGVTVMATPGMFVEFSRQGGLAADGRCKAFSADADGTSWAEGAGVLLLERLSDARRNGRQVLATIRGSAVNQDGHSNGLTAPNGPSQERVIRQALADAGLTAGDVDAVEAHGTGTKLGDPIEAQALLATYGRQRAADRPLWLGSVKSNIGHTQAAAGVAGVIKMVLAMRHGVLPATLHVAEPTPHVAWDADALRLLTEPVQLPADRPARAAVSAFGISGTNGHLILEATPTQVVSPAGQVGTGQTDAGQADAGQTDAGQADAGQPATPLVWSLSARSVEALRVQAGRLARLAAELTEPELVTAGQLLGARARFGERAVVLAADRAELLAGLTALADGAPHPCLITGTAAAEVSPVFVFPGQGTQWAGMAVDLLETSDTFRAQLTSCDQALAPHTGWSVLDVLRGAAGAPELAGSDVIQPVLFAVMVSLSALWRSIGVEPVAVLGHSQGELAAACAAGAIELADAARIVVLRSRALLRLTGTGGMLAVALPAEQAQELIADWPDRLWVAILSGPASTVIAGDLAAIEEFIAAHGEQSRPRRVAIDYAAHTPHIEALRDELAELLAGRTPRPTEIEFCSALHGEFRDTSELIGDYWYQGLRHPVRFAEAVRSVQRYSWPLFIEASPHPVLTGHVQDSLRAAGLPGDAIGTLRRDENGRQRFLLAAAQAYVLGAEVDWAGLLGTAPAGSVRLPGYPFERRRYWIAEAGQAPAGLASSGHPLLGTVLPLAEADGYLCTGRLSLATLPWLADHAVDGSVLLPGTAFVELAMQAAELAGCDELVELSLESPLVLPPAGAVQLQLLVGGPDGAGRRTLSLHSRSADETAGWTRHATGLLGLAIDSAPTAESPAGPAPEWPPAAAELELTEAYDRLADGGYDYGPTFQGLRRAWREQDGWYVEVALPEPADADRFALHPALLDAALHPLVLAAVAETGADSLLLPFSFGGVRVTGTGATELRVRIEQTADDRFSLRAWDAAGHQVVAVESLVLRRATKSAPAGELAGGYSLGWVPGPAAELELTGHRWAVVGVGRAADELAAELVESGAEVSSYYDLVSVADLTYGEPAETVLAPIRIAESDEPAEAAREAVAEVLELLQGWLGDPRFEASRLVLVTAGAVGPATDGTGLIGNAIWGLVRSAAAEHPGRFALVDSDSDGSGAWPAVAGLLAAGEWQLAVRQRQVLVPRLAALSPAPPSPAPLSPADEPADADLTGNTEDLASATVLVTGGTGGLGALVAERLVAEHGVRELLLLSRGGPAATGAAALVARLTELGAEVELLACDVSDRAALAAAIGDRRLSGVVHAAGVVADAPVDRLSDSELAPVFAPKADAAWHLHELTADQRLATFMTFSSVAAVLGNAGQGNYAAANGFLDGLAVYRRAAGLPAVAVAWGLWDVPTGLTGGLAAADVARLGRAGLAPLSAERGLALFDQALSPVAVPNLVAAAWDAGSLRERAESGELTPVLRGLTRASRRASRPSAVSRSTGGRTPAEPSQRGGLAERLAGLAEQQAREVLSELIRAEVAAVLGFTDAEAISPGHAFSELGFDSLTVVDMRNRLDSATGLRLPATLAFDYPTVTALTEHLLRTLAPQTASPEDSLRANLAELEHNLAAQDEATRGKLITILHSTLARLEAVPAGADGAELDVHEQINAASDDEIFAFIDTQL
ncbi:MAG: type I polyketide synthase [Jatrophihabitantaceae bacterium]